MQRTDRTAADVAWARPATIPADLILNYSGPAFAGVEQIRAWGKPYLLGFESITTRAYAGYAAGIADAQQLVSVAHTIPGYVESRCGFWFCAADENSTPSWALPGITEYARAFRSIVGAGPLLAYGNRAAVTAAIAGGADLGWGVGTWGYGEGGGPNLPPGDSDAAIVQSGNTPGPADGTDLNWLYQPLSVFGAWGGPTAQPALASQEDDMVPLVQYQGHPEPRPIFRITEVGGVLYRVRCTPSEVEVLVAAGAVKFKGDFPLIPVLNADQFSALHDVPAGGFSTGSSVQIGTLKFTGTAVPA